MLRVLIIDSMSSHRDTLRKFYTEYGDSSVKAVQYEYDALHLCLQWQPHLLLYGDVDGCQAWKFAYELLSDTLFEFHRPYLVHITLRPSRVQLRLCEECGFNVYEKKPLESWQLIEWFELAKTFRESRKKGEPQS